MSPSKNKMVVRQRILADFGEFALRSEDLDAVLNEACRLVGEAFGTDLAKVMEIEEEEQTLFVRAGVGFRPGVVGRLRLPMGERSSESYSIKERKPVIVPDISKDDRFEFPDFLKEAGAVGMVNVPIFLPGDKAYGLLQVDSRKTWTPDEQDAEFLRTYSTILGPVIDRLHTLHALRRTESRYQTLLRELQHRIKNNIAAITALVQLRMNRTQSEEAREELGIVGARIEALRLVHEQIYSANGTDRLSLRAYLKRVAKGLLALYQDTPIKLEVKIVDVEIKIDTAIPLGLILNEFITNSLKYAFEGSEQKDGLISVETQKKANDSRFAFATTGKACIEERRLPAPIPGRA